MKVGIICIKWVVESCNILNIENIVDVVVRNRFKNLEKGCFWFYKIGY